MIAIVARQIYSIPFVGKLLDYDTFCQLHEDVLEWLLEAEDKLSTMQSLSDELDVVKAQFSKNEDYMSELDAHQHCAVGEVRLSKNI